MSSDLPLEYLSQDINNISPKNNRRSTSFQKSLKKDKFLLHEAAQKGNLSLVKELIKKRKVDVNLKNESGHIPIQLAVLHNYYEIVDLLIESGSDLTSQDNSGWSILHFAAVNGNNEKIIERLLKEPNVDGLLYFNLINFNYISKYYLFNFSESCK